MGLTVGDAGCRPEQPKPTVSAVQYSTPKGASGGHGLLPPRISKEVDRVYLFDDTTYSIIFGRSLKNIGLIPYRFPLRPNSMKHHYFERDGYLSLMC